MTQARRCPRGSANEAASAARRIVPLVALLVIVLWGCSSKKPETNAGANAGSQPGLGQEGLGGTNGSSLSQFQKGTLGQGQGPLSDIHFDYDSYTVRPEDGDILRANADWLEKNPQAKVQIEGHCDARGSEEYNLALGARRAQAAKDYLQTLGIAADRLSTISYGKELPLCTEDTEDCYAQNRRDHFAVTQ
ncbi:MAG TPA: peptidoglycan-associated lipoprotein Pal [Candidatus Binataceae bacterium]|nr:peptidoglycan-associated lipoprotein Pal [Candidatus Binataceae bacterium]